MMAQKSYYIQERNLVSVGLIKMVKIASHAADTSQLDLVVVSHCCWATLVLILTKWTYYCSSLFWCEDYCENLKEGLLERGCCQPTWTKCDLVSCPCCMYIAFRNEQDSTFLKCDHGWYFVLTGATKDGRSGWGGSWGFPLPCVWLANCVRHHLLWLLQGCSLLPGLACSEVGPSWLVVSFERIFTDM